MFACFICISCYSQNEIPKKLLKGIDIEVDEFTNSKTYFSKEGCLSIKESGGLYDLYISLGCYTWDAPMTLKKIYILVGGKVTIIEYNDSDFEHKEQSKRRIKAPSSGKFGTSSYRPAVFESRMVYSDTWKSKDEKYNELIESIILNKVCKVKFEGENKNMFLEFDKKDIAKMESILNLYKYVKQLPKIND